MAVLLSKKTISIFAICAAMLFTSCCTYAFDDSFEEYFQKDFFNTKKSKPQKTPEMTAAMDELKKRKIPTSVDAFVKHVKKNDIEVLQIFVDAGFDVNTDFYTDYPIYYATKANNYEAVEFLLKNGAKPNLGFNTPLIVAIKNKNPKIAHILMEHGARVNSDDFMSGYSLLYTALKLKQYEIANDLINHGAKIDTPSRRLIEGKNLYSVLNLNADNLK